MKKYVYTVKGLDSKENGTAVVQTLYTVLPTAEEVSFSVEQSTLFFSAIIPKEERERIEGQLADALKDTGFELILPEGTRTFRYADGGEKKPKSIPLAVAVSLIAAFSALSILFTFVICGGFYQQPQVIVSGGDNSSETTAEDNKIEIPEGTPDYISDLIKLDEIFRAFSYDGVDEEAMGDAVLKAYISATGDPYAEFMNAEEYAAYNSESAGEFVGVGVSIVNTTIEINGYKYKVLEVISVFENSPALESGLKEGDCILYVGGGENRVMVDVLGYTQALDDLLGEAGTVAEFTVFRPDKTENIGYKEIEFAITRRKVTTESVRYQVSETDSRVGIVNITGFDQTTAPQFTRAVDSLIAEGCEYFVFDVRNNPGGALASIEIVLSYFLNEGDLIVSTEMSDGTKQEEFVSERDYGSYWAGYNISREEIGKYKDLKSVVITNENSASAAELFTATFRDYNIAPIVGGTTYGKGCMQNIYPLDRYGIDGALRVTIAMYFSKSHTVYHGTGIVPDYPVELSEEAKEYNFFLLPEELDDQLQKAIDVLTK
jgi:carboxyl-terminal processing protease